MKKLLRSLLALVTMCGVSALSWALNAEAFGQTYKYLFVGAAGDGGNEYTTLANWKNADGTAFSNSRAPGTYNFYDSTSSEITILIDGNNCPDLTAVDSVKKVVFPGTVALGDHLLGDDGYTLIKLALTNGVHLTDNVYVQAFGATCEVRIDETSKITITQLGEANGTALAGATFYIDSAEGLTVINDVTATGKVGVAGKFTYHFGTNGSAKYQGVLSNLRTHTIASVEGLNFVAETKGIQERTLITYASKDDKQSFTLNALGEGWTAQTSALTDASVAGDYYLNVTDTAVILQYMAGPEDGGEGGGETTDPETPAVTIPEAAANYDYYFTGDTDAVYSTVTNWVDVAAKAVLTEGTAVPGVGDTYEGKTLLLDGDLFNASVTATDGFKAISFGENATYLSGKGLRLTVCNGVYLTGVGITALSGENAITIDASSKMTIAELGVGDFVVNSVTFTVNSEDGLTIHGDMTNAPSESSKAFTYNLNTADARVTYTGALTGARTHHFATVAGVDLGDDTLPGKAIASRTLMTFASAENQTFTATLEGMIEDAALNDVGDYVLEKTATELTLKYVVHAAVPEDLVGFDYIFTGKTQLSGVGLYSTASNWQSIQSSVAAPTVAPGIATEGAPTGKLLLDGNRFDASLTADTLGFKKVTFYPTSDTYQVAPANYLTGNQLDLTLRNGVHLGDRVVVKGFTDAAINVDATSRMTITKLGTGENTLNNVTVTVNSNNGLIVDGDVSDTASTGTSTFTYHLNAADATVAYTGAVSGARTHHFATIVGIDLGNEALTGMRVVSRTVMNFADTTSFGDDQIFTFAAPEGMTEDATLDNVGDYTFEKTGSGLNLKYVMRARADVVINIPEVDTSIALVADWSDLKSMKYDAGFSWKLDNNGYQLAASETADLDVERGVLTLGKNETAAFSLKRRTGTTFRASTQTTAECYISNIPENGTTAIARLSIVEDLTPVAGSGNESIGNAYYLLTANPDGVKLEYAWVSSIRPEVATSPICLTDGGFHTVRMAYKNNTCKVYIDGQYACELSEKAEGIGTNLQGHRVLTVKDFSVGSYLGESDYNRGFDLHGMRLYSDPEVLASLPTPIVSWQGFTAEALSAIPYAVTSETCTMNTEGALVIGAEGLHVAAALPSVTVVADVEVPKGGGSVFAFTSTEGAKVSSNVAEEGRQFLRFDSESAIQEVSIPLVGAKVHALYIYPSIVTDEELAFSTITESYVRYVDGEEYWVDAVEAAALDALDPQWNVKTTGQDDNGQTIAIPLDKPADGAEVVLNTTAVTTLTMDADAALTKLEVKGNSSLTFAGTNSLTAVHATIRTTTDLSGITSSFGLLTVASGTTTLGASTAVSAVTVAEGATLVVPEGVTIAGAVIAGTVKGSGTLTNATFAEGAGVGAGLTLTNSTFNGAIKWVVTKDMLASTAPTGVTVSEYVLDSDDTLTVVEGETLEITVPLTINVPVENNGTLTVKSTVAMTADVASGANSALIIGDGTTEATLTVTQESAIEGLIAEVKANATLEYSFSGSKEIDTLAGIMGEGTLKFTSPEGDTNWVSIVPNSEGKVWAEALSLANYTGGGILLKNGNWNGKTLKVRNLSGTGNFRNDWDSGTSTLEVTQTKDTTYSGSFATNASNRKMNLTVKGENGAKLILSGLSVSQGTLTVDETGLVILTTETAWGGALAGGMTKTYHEAEGTSPAGYYVKKNLDYIDKVIAVWDNFTGMSDEGLSPSVGFSQTQNNVIVDGSTLKFYQEGGEVDRFGVLSTGTTTAPRIDLAEGDGAVDVGYNKFPITVVMAIQAPVSATQTGKPLVVESGNHGIGTALLGSGQLIGCVKNTTNGTAKEVAALTGDQKVYLVFIHTSGGARVGVVENNTITWVDVFDSALKFKNNINATDIFFGNYQGATATGMDFDLCAVALLAGNNTADATLNASILACVERMEKNAIYVHTWAGTTTESTNAGTWNTATDNLMWKLGNESVAFENGKDVVFADIDGVTASTVTVGENVSPASVLVKNDTTAYTIGGTAGAIAGDVVVTKKGDGSLTLSGPSTKSTRIAELVMEAGTVTLSGHYALIYNARAFGSQLTIKGGTLNLNGSGTFQTGVWLTDKPITMGGSTVAARIEGHPIVGFTNENFLTYVGGENVPSATFASNYHSTWQDSANTRNITVGVGKDTATHDLEMSGTLGMSGGEFAKTTFVKKGAGTLKLSGQNNIPAMTIAEGKVIAEDAEALSATMTINAGATLDLAGYLEAGITFSGTGTITNTAETELTLTSSQLATFSGTIRGNIKVEVDISEVLEGGKPYPFTMENSQNITITGAIPDYLSEYLEFNSETGLVTEKYRGLDYQISWMPVGDSITEGEANMGHEGGSSDTRGGYRYQLWKLMDDKLGAGVAEGKDNGQEFVTVGFRTGHFGTTDEVKNEDGTITCAHADWAWHSALYGGVITPYTDHGGQLFNVETALEHAGYPEIISLMLGINDLSFHTDEIGRENVYASLMDLIDKIAKARPHSKVVVSTLFPNNNANTKNFWHPFNEKMRAEATGKTSAFVNKNVIFADVAKWAFNDTFTVGCFKSDALHPNETGSILIAKAFRLGFLKALDTIAKDDLAIAQVHNGEDGKLVVRLNKTDTTTLETAKSVTVAGTDVNNEAVNVTLTNGTLLGRCYTFTDAPALKGGTYTVTLKISDATTVTSDATKTQMDIIGRHVAKDEANSVEEVYAAAVNVPEDYRKGFVPLKRYELGEESAAMPEALTASSIARVGYYMELKRPGKPAQFVWVSMAADAFGDSSVEGGVNVGLPIAKIKAKVNHLQVYGNRGNFTNTAADAAGVQGIIEFTPYGWNAGDETGYVNEGSSGRYGWNDTLLDTGDLKGCMQVARIRTLTGGRIDWRDPAAEMLFAYNNFACATTDDFGIGSFHTHRNNSGTSPSPNSVFDWTDFASVSGYTAYQPGFYESRVLEVWVEAATTATWTGAVSGDWNNPDNWEPAIVPTANTIELSETAANTLTLTEGTYIQSFVGSGALKIAGEVTLGGSNMYTGGTILDANAVLTMVNGAAIGTGTITGSGRLIYPAGYPQVIAGLTDRANWTGTVEVTDVSFSENVSTIENLGNDASAICIKGDNNTGTFGWQSNANSSVTCNSAIELLGTFSLTRGHAGRTQVFAGKLTGNGTFINNNASNYSGYVIQFNNAGDFGGTMTVTGDYAKTRIGTSGEVVAGGMLISGTANIAEGKTWTAKKGITLSGTIKGCGTLAATAEGVTTLTLQDGATLDATAGILNVTGTISASGTLNVILTSAPTTKTKVLSATTVTSDLTDSTVTLGEEVLTGWKVVAGEDGLYIEDVSAGSSATLTPSTGGALAWADIAWSNAGHKPVPGEAVTLSLTQDTVLDIGAEAVNVGALTVTRAEGVTTTPTLTLTNGANLTATSITLNDVIYAPGITSYTVPFEGNGTVVYAGTSQTVDGTLPTVADACFKNSTKWTGTFCFKTFKKDNIDFAKFSNAGSKIMIDGMTGWLQQADATGEQAGKEFTFAELIIGDAGWWIDNGNSADKTTLHTKLTGSGLIKLIQENSSDPTCAVCIDDASEFTGSITVDDNFALLIGQGTHQSGKIIVAEGKLVRIAENQTWTTRTGFMVSGSLSGSGTIAGALTFADGATYTKATADETLTINGNLACNGILNVNLPADATLPLDILSVSGEGHTVTHEPSVVHVTIGGEAQTDVIVSKSEDATTLTLEVSTTSQDWSPVAGEDPVAWGSGGTGSWTEANKPTSADTVIIRISGDTTIALPEGDTTIHTLEVLYAEGVTSGTLTFTGGTLITSTAVIGANTDVSATTTNLGDVMIEPNVTLSAKKANFSSVTGEGTLYLKEGTLTYGSTLSDLTVHVANAAILDVTGRYTNIADTFAIILDGGAMLYLKNGSGTIAAPITVSEKATTSLTAKIYASSNENELDITGGIELLGVLELASGSFGSEYFISGNISGKGMLIVNDANNYDNVTLSGNNTFEGGLVVNQNLTAKSYSVGSGDITVAVNKVLTISDNVALTVATDKTLAGGGTIKGSVTFAGNAVVDASAGAPIVTGTVTWGEAQSITFKLPGVLSDTNIAYPLLLNATVTVPEQATVMVGDETMAYTVIKAPMGLYVTNGAMWLGSTDTSWNTATNWASGTAPATSAKVFLAAGAPHTLTLTDGTYSNVFTGDGALAIDGEVKLTATNTYTGGTTIPEGFMLIVSDITKMGGSGAAATINGTLKFWSTGDVNEAGTVNLHNLTGTGTIWYASSTTGLYRTLPKDPNHRFASTLGVRNDQSDGLVITKFGTAAAPLITEIGSLSGSKSFRADWRGVTNGAILRIVQGKATEHTGSVFQDNGAGNVALLKVAGANGVTATSLTLSGTSQAVSRPLEVEATGHLILNTPWAESVTVSGILGGTGSIGASGKTVTFNNGATLDATLATEDARLTVAGTLTLGTTLNVVLPVAVASVTGENGLMVLDGPASETAPTAAITLYLGGEPVPEGSFTATWTEGDLYVKPVVKLPAATEKVIDPETSEVVKAPETLSEKVVQEILMELKKHNDDKTEEQKVTTITAVTVTGTNGATTLASHSAEAAHLFTELVEVKPSETAGEATAMIAYDFGIHRLTVKRIDNVSYVVFGAKVKGRSEGTTYAEGTQVVAELEVPEGVTPPTSLEATTAETVGESSVTGEAWFRVPLGDLKGIGTYNFKVRATK